MLCVRKVNARLESQDGLEREATRYFAASHISKQLADYAEFYLCPISVPLPPEIAGDVNSVAIALRMRQFTVPASIAMQIRFVECHKVVF